MNNLNSIVDYLKVFNNINKRPAQEPRNMYQDGQLVQNTVDGSRPGYGGDWKNTTNYKKTREAMKKGLVYDLKTKRMRKHKPLTGARGYANNPEGRPKLKMSDWTLEQKANLETWMDNTGSTLEDYNKLPSSTKNNIKYARITGIKQTPEFAKKLESAATKQFRNWLSKQDPKTLTADSVDDLIKQSKIKTTSTNQRSGLVNAINRILEEKESSKFKNIQLGRVYPTEEFDKFADAVLDAYAKDDITKLTHRKYASNINRVRDNLHGNLDNLVKKTGLDEETIFNLFDDREAFQELELSEDVWKRGRQIDPDKAKFYKQAENWIVKNSKRYADPDKFKKAFIRTFGKNNDILQKINRPDKRTIMRVPFSDWFRTNIMGTSEQGLRGQVKPSYSSAQLDNIFKTAIYTNNENVRNKITKEIKSILPEPGSKRVPDIRKALNENPLLRKFGLNYQIRGPIARLLAKEVGDDLIKQISFFRKPWLGTYELLTYLKDRVDPKYKSMFEESAKAVRYTQKNQWPEARKAFNLSESIMFDHKVPKALMQLGYADEIEYIKLNPTSADFNTRIKRIQFDMPMVKLVNQWEKAQTLDAKSKAVGEMNTLKDKFSKKYGNYLDDVKINVDKTGKPMFSSKTPVVTKKTDLVKSLKASLQQQKGIKLKPVKLGSFPANIDADMFDFRKLPDDMRHFTDVTKKFVAQSPTLSKAFKTAKGASKWTGWALAGEPAFAAPFAEYGYKMGESPERLWGDATFGLVGETEKEELKKATGELGYATQQIDNYDSQLQALETKFRELNDQNDPRGEKRKTIGNVYEHTRGKYGKAYNMFVDDQGQFDKGKYDQGLNNYTAGLVQIDKFKKQKQDERIKQAGGYDNIVQEREIRDIKGYASGGIASLMKK